jgi:uncharacterized protein (DUF1778 family)
MSTATSDARLNFRLTGDAKATIEEAAALSGQTVSDFAIAALTASARQVIDQHDQTLLNSRQREAFLALLDHKAARPNKALAAAARRYKKRQG